MPTYVYHCDQCESDFEARQKFSDGPLSHCPEGHEEVRRIFVAPAIVFKGDGWYSKDSRSDRASSPAGSRKTGDSDGESSESKTTGESESPAASSDTKSESKSESKKEGPSSEPASEAA